MLAGLLLPGRPVGNMYFAAWSHNVILNTVNLCNDLKMGEYRMCFRSVTSGPKMLIIDTVKIPPRTMFATQIYGTTLGAFVNYAVMISIVTNNRELLVDSNGNSSWSGATIQSYNTNATAWAMAKYLYKTGAKYQIVPLGLIIGAGAVAVHRAFVYVSTPYLPHRWYLSSFILYAGADCI